MMVGQLPDYRKALQEHHASEGAYTQRKQSVEGHSLHAEMNAEIEKLTLDKILERKERCKEIAETKESLSTKITVTETGIRDKKNGLELEDGLASRQNAMDKLQAVFERNLSSITGDLLVGHLKKSIGDLDRYPGAASAVDEACLH